MSHLNVIWVASFPKSGNTWVNNVIRRAGRRKGFPQKSMGVHKMIQAGESPAVCAAVKERFSSKPCTVLKTHACYRTDRELHRFRDVHLHNVGFIHVYRNPLDVLLSYINFTRRQYQNFADRPEEKRREYENALFLDLMGFDSAPTIDEWKAVTLDTIPRTNLDHALDRYSDGGLCIETMRAMSGTWLEHARSWTAAKKDMPGVSIRYEDCLSDRRHFLPIIEFFRYTEQNVFDAVEFFQNHVNDRKQGGARKEKVSIFFNKMQAYYFTRYFSPAAIERFMARHGDVLAEFGYGGLVDGSAIAVPG